MKFFTYGVNNTLLEQNGCYTVATVSDGRFDIDLVMLKDEDGKISYEYELYEMQHQVYTWKAPNVGRLNDGQLCNLLYKVITDERMERTAEKYGA